MAKGCKSTRYADTSGNDKMREKRLMAQRDRVMKQLAEAKGKAHKRGEGYRGYLEHELKVAEVRLEQNRITVQAVKELAGKTK